MGKIGQKGNPGQTRFGQKTEVNLENWLNAHFETSPYRPNYTQAKRHVGGLLKLAGSARNELEENLSKISSKREDVKKNYNIYRSAVEKAIMHMEDSISQMEMLKASFFAAHPGKKTEYEERLSVLKKRLADLEREVKWLPRQLQGHRFKRIDHVINEEIALLSPRGAVPKKSPKAERDEMREVDKAIHIAKKDMGRQKIGERPKKHEIEPTEGVMVITEKEAEELQQAAEREEKTQRQVAFKRAREYGKEMARLKKEGKPTGAIARKRFEAYAEYIALGGDLGKVPMNVAKALYEEGRLV